MAFWDGWYETATEKVSSSIKAVEDWTSDLFKAPIPGTAGGISPEDPAVTQSGADVVRSGGDKTLFYSDPILTADIDRLYAAPRRTELDEINDLTEGQPSGTPQQLFGQAAEAVTGAASKVTSTVGGFFKGIGNLGGFFQTTLTKVILVLIFVVVGLFFLNRLASRATGA